MELLQSMSADWRKAIPVLLILFTGLLPHFTLGADHYKPGDKLYVAPTSGVRVRALPAITAPVLAYLDFNSVVTVVADSLPAKPFQMAVTDFNSGELSLRGHWIKVKTGKGTGYVFDGMLSEFKGLKQGSYEEEPYYVSLFGTPSLKTIEKSKVVEGKKLDYETQIKTYPRGFVMQSTFFDGCYDQVYTFQIPFNEAYWLIQRMMLDADAAQEIKINGR